MAESTNANFNFDPFKYFWVRTLPAIALDVEILWSKLVEELGVSADDGELSNDRQVALSEEWLSDQLPSYCFNSLSGATVRSILNYWLTSAYSKSLTSRGYADSSEQLDLFTDAQMWTASQYLTDDELALYAGPYVGATPLSKADLRIAIACYLAAGPPSPELVASVSAAMDGLERIQFNVVQFRLAEGFHDLLPIASWLNDEESLGLLDWWFEGAKTRRTE